MYLHLGQETVVKTNTILGIFDLENTSLSKFTKEFLASETKRGAVVNVSYEMPKSYVLCEEHGREVLYISQISSRTLLKRANLLPAEKDLND